MKNLPPYLKGARRKTEKKNERLQRAAKLSRHTKSADEIISELCISDRTLKRYVKDPLWQECGGIPLVFQKGGRPVRDTLSHAEQRLLVEATARHDKGLTWQAAADELGITLDRLNYLRHKAKVAPEKCEGDDTPSPVILEQLTRAYQYRDAGKAWKDIPSLIGISYSRLRYLRSKYPRET